MKLVNLIEQKARVGRRAVIPLMGFPGIHLTKSSIKQNEFNSVLQFKTVSRLVERFAPDAIFFMMDLSVEAGALGLPVRFPLFESATVEDHPVRKVEDLERFQVLDPLEDARIQVFLNTMRLMKKHIAIPKGAYVTGPFTLAGLMIGATEIASNTILNPHLVKSVLEFVQRIVIRYARSLVQAGADIIAILEPTAVLLSPSQFEEFCGKYIRRIVAHLDHVATILHVCGNSSHLIEKMCETGVEGLSLDSLVNLPEVAQRVRDDITLLGNIDPVRVMVNMKPDEVERETLKLLNEMRDFPNFILSTGCDLPPETPFENIDAFMSAGRNWRF